MLSIVGAVVIMAGAFSKRLQSALSSQIVMIGVRITVCYILGGRLGLSAVPEACAFDVADSCGSDALWNLNKLNRRCLGDCSCTLETSRLDDVPIAKERLDSVAFGKGSWSADSGGRRSLGSMLLYRRRSGWLD